MEIEISEGHSGGFNAALTEASEVASPAEADLEAQVTLTVLGLVSAFVVASHIFHMLNK
jgi:hypothetical protein